MVHVEIKNSKFEYKSKDISRLNRLNTEEEFTKILESKVDLNLKIAKILTNAMNWKINFDAFKEGKTILLIPIKRDAAADATL